MSIFQRVVLLLKVLVMLSIGISSAWASQSPHLQGFNSIPGHDAGLVLAKSDAEGGDKGQGGSEGDDDSTTDEPDSDDSDDGDSQS
ncbi:hypothetical protein [Pseudomonas vancouverensis]|uniref:Secreted protein n=1 Tax=Pseudomonas vancouverensis TaxID=95300 RepID=A0A1H2P983_PSEVA|nr:hypothetical protein [Pseudomonas vancouverensis]KAB0490088.1 hypothetical protein F7R09_27675 [Pseudomonas vancouverensis]TDB58808.1 hypothetical protein EIY72_21150 [Pseudomonas vancouverensis]SDV14268.1 hypothetical protein SAMN05216558_4343 [Pseudomonas vancouverensis]